MPILQMLALLLALDPQEARVLKAGETLTLAEDLELSGGGSLEIQGTAEKRCTIVGNNHQILTKGKWTGRVSISYCDLRGLGAGERHALDLKASGQAEIAIDHCVFEESSSVSVRTDDQSSARFTNNLSRENSNVPMDKALEKSRSFFQASGSSTAAKVFKGNQILRSSGRFEAPNWLIEDNVFIGFRTGIFAYGKDVLVRGNYTHCLMPRTAEFPYWSQVSTFTTAKGAVAEDNVIRDGEWIVQFVEGEFRRNVICDINDHNFLRNGSTGRIHHNIFVAGKPNHPPGSMSACIFVVYAPKGGEEGVEVFNNTFDAGGTMNVPGVEVNPGGWVKSVRNNVFYNFGHKEKYLSSAQAMIRPCWTEGLTEPLPVRLGYSDYNLFFSPGAQVHRNYALGVRDKAERKDAGFGLNDVPRGGARNEQVDPKFKGPIPSEFAFQDEDIKSGKVTVAKMLAHYRDIYTPAPGSPLIGAGDPADGEGTSIGAVEVKK
jgi:hypothetical protein